MDTLVANRPTEERRGFLKSAVGKRKNDSFEEEDIIESTKKMKSNDFFKDNRFVTPLSSHIQFLSLGDDGKQEKPKEKKRKRKVEEDIIDDLLDSRKFSKMKISHQKAEEKSEKQIEAKLVLNYEEEGERKEEKGTEEEKKGNTLSSYFDLSNYSLYTKINTFLRDLTLERLSRQSKN